MSDSVSIIVSVGTVIIALCALAVSAGSLYANRRHNRMSVRPLLVRNNIFEPELFRIEIHNAGLGPAKIASVEVFIDGQHEGNKTVNQAYRQVLEELKRQSYRFISGDTDAGYSVQVGSSLPLFEMDVSPFKSMPAEWHELRKTVMRVGFRVEYKSLYDESFTLEEKD